MARKQPMNDPEIRKELRKLTANMVGSLQNIQDCQARNLDPDWFPKGMEFEKEVVKACYYLADSMSAQNPDERYEPSRQNVLDVLALRKIDAAEGLLVDLMSHRTNPAQVRVTLQMLHNWQWVQSTKKAVSEELDRLDSHFDIQTGYSNLLQSVAASQPTGQSSNARSHVQVLGSVMDDIAIRGSVFAGGGYPGPIFKYKGVRRLISYTEKGEVVLVVGRSKGHKSTWASDQAHWLAYDMPGGKYDVYVMLFETPPEDMAVRDLCRETKIPMANLLSGGIRMPDGKVHEFNESSKWWMDITAPYREKVAKCAKERGEIKYVPCAGIPVTELLIQVQDYIRQSEQRGREAIFIWDYLQATTHLTIDEEQHKNNKNADLIKQITVSHGVRSYLLAQDDVNPDYNSDVVRVWNGNKVIMVAQTVIRLERQRVDKDEERMNGTVPMLNAFKEQIYWHESGEFGDMVWNVRLANRGKPGKYTTKVCNAYFEIADPYEA